MTTPENHGPMSSSAVYQHPLAYLLGLQGVALLRAYAGEYNRDFTRARIAEVRALLEREEEFGVGWEVGPLPAEVGYDEWAPTYDGENPFFAMDEGSLLPILDDIPPGRAVDAACGTGRYAAHLTARGHVQARETPSALRPSCWAVRSCWSVEQRA